MHSPIAGRPLPEGTTVEIQPNSTAPGVLTGYLEDA